MADTCYGQSDTERPELSTLVVDEVGDAVMPDAAPPSPVAGQPSAAREAAGPATPTVPVEAAAGASTTAPSSATSNGPTAGAAEPRLALEQMTPVVDGGILMIFGPEGDPVPPQAFVDAAVLRPDLQLKLPDDTAVRADRIAIVLGAQMLGRLGADERNDAWILMMLGQGDRPEPASDDALHAEQSHPEPVAEPMLQAGVRTHPDADRGDQPGVVADAQVGDPADDPGAGVGAEAGAEASRCDSGKDSAPRDQAQHPSVGNNQDTLPQVELDLDCLADITDSSLDFDLDLDFATEDLDLSGDRLDGEADDRSGIGHERARDDASLAMTGHLDGQHGGGVADQTSEGAPAVRDEASLVMTGHLDGPRGGGVVEQTTEVSGLAREAAPLADGQSGDGMPYQASEAAPPAREDASLVMAEQLDGQRGGGMPDQTFEVGPPMREDTSPVMTGQPDSQTGAGVPDQRSEVAQPAREAASTATTDQPGGQGGCDVPDQMPEAAPPMPPRLADPVGHAAQPGGGAAGPITEHGAGEGLSGDAYPDDGPDAGAAVEAERAVETVETIEHGPVARQHDNPVRQADVGPGAGWPEPEGEPARISTQGAAGQIDVDPDGIALVVIRGVPEDARLSTGTRDEDGSWSISPLDLASVVISLAEDTSHGAVGEPLVEGDLDITGIAITEQGELVAISETVPLADYVAESPTGQVGTNGAATPAVAANPPMIALDIDPGVWADEQFDALVIRDVPPGARLSAGSYDPSIDGWVLMLQDLPTLAITPPADLCTGFSLTLMGVALRPGDGNAARVLARLPVSMA